MASPDDDDVKLVLHKLLQRPWGSFFPSEIPPQSTSVPHAPRRLYNKSDEKLAVKNALRYFQAEQHSTMGAELLSELRDEGHIYMRRFKPTEYKVKAYPLDYYPGKSVHARVIMLMIMNNLDSNVAQFPEELVTYGGNGSVFSNWAQYHLAMYYLSQMTEEQTLKLASGHPAGLFPSSPAAPRLVITNGMVIPNYSSKKDYDRLYSLGVSQYGQMTAGSFCYIGPQGIVHGTTITILNAGRKYLGIGLTDSTEDKKSLAGTVYLSSGLGGMSGAQGKAAVICGAVSVIAEVDPAALEKRFVQGWVLEKCYDLDECIARIVQAKKDKKPTSIGFLGNVVSLWERIAEYKSDDGSPLVELASDQTSLHNPYNGGYYPVQLTFEESKAMMVEDPAQFKTLVQESLRRQVTAINKCTAQGTRFWDYGNCFLLEALRAGAEIAGQSSQFRYPSYVQDIMGDIFSLGFGPFRWVCTSGDPADLALTDEIAANVIRDLRKSTPNRVTDQWNDNLMWIEQAGDNKMVVGSQARILYADAQGRTTIALAFNKAFADGNLKGPVVLSRDHHDVSGTDSPFRETSNIYDGSQFCADMAIHNVIGDSFRGASWVAIHNGGGTGWGEVMNGGFGLVLDGSDAAAGKAEAMLFWDVNNGVSRRAWSGNDNADFAIRRAMEANPNLQVTVASHVQTDVLDKLF